MAQPERLGRELREDLALEIKCGGCGAVTSLPRALALEQFGPQAMVTEVREKARCASCGAGDCLIDLVKTGVPGSPRPPSAPIPVERITFAVCQAAGWSVYGQCEPCRMLKALYAPGANVGPKAPGLVISRAARSGKLVCGKCRTPFSRVYVGQDREPQEIAAWSPQSREQDLTVARRKA